MKKKINNNDNTSDNDNAKNIKRSIIIFIIIFKK